MPRVSQPDFDKVANLIRQIAIEDWLDRVRFEIWAAWPKHLDEAQRDDLIELCNKQNRRIDADIRKATRSIRGLICPPTKPRQLELF